MRKIITFLMMVLATQAFGQGKDVKFDKLKKENPDFAASVLYANGVQAKLFGEVKAASQAFTKVLELNPNHAAAHYQLAMLVDRAKYPNVALGLAEKAFTLDSLNADYVSYYIEMLISSNRFTQAKKILENMKSRGRISQKNSYYMVALAGQMGQLGEAEKLANEYLDNWGFNAQIVEILSNSMMARSRYAEVETMLEDYITDYPTEASIRVMLAKLKAALHKDQEAEELFASAIELDADDLQARLAISDYYRAKDDKKKYIESLKPIFESDNLTPEGKAKYFEQLFFDPELVRENFGTVLQIAAAMYASDPYNAEVERVHIRFLIFLGNIDAAKELLIARVREDKASVNTFVELIGIENYQKNLDSSLYYVALGEKRFPKSHELIVASAVIYSIQEKASLAIKALGRALKVAPSDSVRGEIKTLKGDLYYQQGDLKKAFAAYDKALGYHYDNAAALNNYAYFLSLEKRRLDEALKMAHRANQLSESNPTYLDTEAWVLYQMGRYEEARLLQRQALALEREPSSELLMHYGDIMFKLNNAVLAETYWKRALEAGADAKDIETRLKQLK